MNTTANTTAGRTRIAARLIVGTATLALGLVSLTSTALAGPVTGPTDIVACPTQGLKSSPDATFVSPAPPVRPTGMTFVLPTSTPTVKLPDPTLVLPPPVGDPEPTGATFAPQPSEEPDCGHDPETTEPTDDTPTPGQETGTGDNGGSDGTPAADTGDLAYTGVGAGVMTLGGLVLLGGGALVLLAVRHLSRRVG
jgi:hypothetical protein